VKRAKNVGNFQPIDLGRDGAGVLGLDKVPNHKKDTVTRQCAEGSIWSTTKKQDHIVAWEQQGINVKF
jgi:hypothetical protein